MDDLILKLKNLNVLLEEAIARGSKLEVRELITEIKQTVDDIEKKRFLQKSQASNTNN